MTDRKAASPLLFATLFAAACGGVQLRSPIAAAPGPPATFLQTTSDVRSTRVVDVREGLGKPAAFRAARDLLEQRFAIDVSDEKAGFLMTPWQTGVTREGAPELRYRTRMIIRFLGEDWKQASVRAEANWRRAPDEWDIGYDAKALDDVVSELKTKIGK
jgi:hypothetical protein